MFSYLDDLVENKNGNCEITCMYTNIMEKCYSCKNNYCKENPNIT